ncbi:MAG TPA: hypothetical protein PKN33_02630 [Phycisphaerae bacterium]|nr:hypothetical protein [Phycisphaerae bacterium]
MIFLRLCPAAGSCDESAFSVKNASAASNTASACRRDMIVLTATYVVAPMINAIAVSQ